MLGFWRRSIEAQRGAGLRLPVRSAARPATFLRPQEAFWRRWRPVTLSRPRLPGRIDHLVWRNRPVQPARHTFHCNLLSREPSARAWATGSCETTGSATCAGVKRERARREAANRITRICDRRRIPSVGLLLPDGRDSLEPALPRPHAYHGAQHIPEPHGTLVTNALGVFAPASRSSVAPPSGSRHQRVPRSIGRSGVPLCLLSLRN
jgi:hypothetical protein